MKSFKSHGSWAVILPALFVLTPLLDALIAFALSPSFPPPPPPQARQGELRISVANPEHAVTCLWVACQIVVYTIGGAIFGLCKASFIAFFLVLFKPSVSPALWPLAPASSY